MNWQAYFLGVISSLTTILLVWIFKNQIINVINLLFFKIYPNIKGRYKLIFSEKESQEKQIMVLHQFGTYIWGTSETFDIKDNCVSKDIIKGRITASRILLFKFETITEDCHNFGTGTFKLFSGEKALFGYITCLCAKCEKTTSFKVKLEKIN